MFTTATHRLTLLEVIGQAPEILDIVGDFFDTDQTLRQIPCLVAGSQSIYKVLWNSRRCLGGLKWLRRSH